jgi:hypothetical protein
MMLVSYANKVVLSIQRCWMRMGSLATAGIAYLRELVADEALFFRGMVLRQGNGTLAVTGGADKLGIDPAPSSLERLPNRPVTAVCGNNLTFPPAGAQGQETDQYQHREEAEGIPAADSFHLTAPCPSMLI